MFTPARSIHPAFVLVALFAPACTSAGDDDTGSDTSPTTVTAATTATSMTTMTASAGTTTAQPTTSASEATSGASTTADDPTMNPGESGDPSTTTTATTPSTSTSEPGTTTDEPETGDPVVQDCQTPPCFNVINKCGFPLWIHAANNANVVLAPDLAMVAPGGVQQLSVPPEWPAGRVNAYFAEPNANPQSFDKVEMTVTGGVMNYNITYVDYVSLPSEMVAVGPECPTTPDFDPKIGCYVPRDQLLNGCPDDLRTGDVCLSASIYCADGAHQDLPYCHALDAQIAACAQQHPETCGVAATLGNSTRHVYGCSGYFDSQPPNCMPATPECHHEGNKWCAALNRGKLADPESTDVASYYQSAPFNTYSKWVHDTCPGIYAFAYDDYPANAGESGFRACKADRLDITFCPAG